jgi:hypothetical protein
MNKLEIFQEVYGKDYVFTVTELSRLQRVAELIVKECINICENGYLKGIGQTYQGDVFAEEIKRYFGVEA